MKKQKSKYFKIIILIIMIFFCLTSLYSQAVKNIRLKEKVSRMKDSVTYLYFIQLDSVIDSKGKLSKSSLKELNEISSFFYKNYYYNIKVGYYVKDSTNMQPLLKSFTLFKDNLKKADKKRVIKIDYNCQAHLSIYSHVLKYEEDTGTSVGNTIILMLKKSKERIDKLNYRRNCYF